jgi:hypothetical protein
MVTRRLRRPAVVLAVLCFATSLLVVPAFVPSVGDRVLTPAGEAVLAGARAGQQGRYITVERDAPAPDVDDVRAGAGDDSRAAGAETRRAPSLTPRAEPSLRRAARATGEAP